MLAITSYYLLLLSCNVKRDCNELPYLKGTNTNSSNRIGHSWFTFNVVCVDRFTEKPLKLSLLKWQDFLGLKQLRQEFAYLFGLHTINNWIKGARDDMKQNHTDFPVVCILREAMQSNV